ncbi:unnamed protein product, partial [Musa acuminata subsp. burmannicoides]
QNERNLQFDEKLHRLSVLGIIFLHGCCYAKLWCPPTLLWKRKFAFAENCFRKVANFEREHNVLHELYFRRLNYHAKWNREMESKRILVCNLSDYAEYLFQQAAAAEAEKFKPCSAAYKTLCDDLAMGECRFRSSQQSWFISVSMSTKSFPQFISGNIWSIKFISK